MRSSENLDERIESAWEKKWIDLLTVSENISRNGKTCQWLYNDIVMDALGNIFPCCSIPTKKPVSVFGNIVDSNDPYNSGHYVFSREYFANPDRFRDLSFGFACKDDEREFVPTVCQGCKQKNFLPNVNIHQIPAYFRCVDTGGGFSHDGVIRLAKWD